MSTDIKPGQVWAWNDGRPTVQVLHVTGSLAFYRILPNGEDHYAVPLSTLAIEAHLATDTYAIPAPLDASKVQAGDTVTLEKGTATHTDQVNEVDHYQDGDFRFKSATSPTHVYRVGEGAWTLTAHQPAPKPEWKPGTSGTATINSVPDARVMRAGVAGVMTWWLAQDGCKYSDEEVTDFVPDETRPLPTRVAMAEAMHDDRLPGGEPRLTYLQRLILADAIIANQRGESR